MKRALYRLELATPADESDLYRDLVRLLGQVDGTLFPVRFAGDSGRYAAETLSQRDYLNGGISYSTEQDDTSQQVGWKRSERTRTAMAAAGWITIESNAKVRLTMAGDVLGRSLVGQASLNDLVPQAIFELLKRATPDRSSGWVSESTLFQVDSTNSDDYQECSEAMLPLISFGFVECCSSTISRLFYRMLVDELHFLILSGCRSVLVPCSAKVDCAIGEYDEQLSEAYTQAFCNAIKQRHLRDVGSELVLPLAATT